MMGYSGYGGMIKWLTLFITGGGIVPFAFIQSKRNGMNLKDRPDECP
jgi:hypothetical protein